MSFNAKAFSNPLSSMRPMPLWTWNGNMTRERITETMQQFKEQGMGGVFIHPRPGMITEYLSDNWFDLWRWALEEAKKLGLECNIYDEDTYPSGYGGGHVVDRVPDIAARYLVAKLILPGEKIPSAADTLWIEELPHSNAKLFVMTRPANPTPWTAWHPPVDMLDARVSKTFIEATHEAYAAHVSDEFGKNIFHVFSDEPTWMMRDEHCRDERSLPFTPELFPEFKKDHGYALEGRIIDLFIPGEAGRTTRYDYYSTLQRIWLNNFLRPIYEWCEAHHLKYTGHFMEHEWPLPLNQGSTMDAMRWMHTPGIDLLGFQYNFNDPSKNDWMLLNIKEAASVARQLGRERVLCESHGGGGHNLRLEQFKELTDWAIVHGINLINPHMSDQTLAGARKFDWPQTLSDHSPWWPEYHLYADHTARLTAAVTQGELANRTLLLHPSTSGWLHFIPEEVDGVFNEPLMALRHSQCTLIKMLADRQVDFDLGDELLMKEFAGVEGGKLRIGRALYDQVILPEHMENWCESTLLLMRKYLQGGGILLALGRPPERVNGRLDSRPVELEAEFPNGWRRAGSLESLHEQIIKICPPRIAQSDGSPLPAGVHHQFRILENGDNLHYIANANHAACVFRIRIKGRSAKQLNTFDGSLSYMPVEDSGGMITAEIELPEAGHLLLISSMEGNSVEINLARPARIFKPIGAFTAVRRTAPNLLTIDYCTISFRGKTLEKSNVMDADLWIWQQLGFPRNIWDWSVQFKDSYSRYTFDDTTGFTVEYRFMADAARKTLNSIELALERSHLYRISVNGQPADFSNAVGWFDQEIQKAPIGTFLKNGENVIRLEIDRFDIFCEIAQIYLLGEFSTRPVDTGFCITDPVPLCAGDWVQCGLHFYSGRMIYEATLDIPDKARQLTVRIPEWEGAAIRIRLDGKEAGFIAFPPYELCVPAPKTGTHRLEIEVIGTLRNLLGSHFCDGIASRWSWENHPRTAPAGNVYRFVPQGLIGPVEYAIET
jgi:hypothetical protein